MTGKIIGCAYEVFGHLNFGHQEAVYERSLLKELRENGLKAECQLPLKVEYKGEIVGEYFADMFVEDKVLLELKSVRALTKDHEIQLVSYLTVTGVDVGLLINFGPGGVQVKRQVRRLETNDKI